MRDAGEQIIGALVAIIGVIKIIFGGFQRKTEDVAPATTETAPQTPSLRRLVRHIPTW